MKVPTLGFSAIRRTRSKDQTGVVATARLDQRTKNLIKRLKPGDIAIIDHIDLDRVAADALVRSQVKAVINVAPSISGRYPNQGPQVLIDAGIPLVDDVGPDVFDQVNEGQQNRLDGETVYLADAVVAKGTWQTAESVASDMALAKDGLAEQLRAFVTNTFEYINRDSELLVEGLRMPDPEDQAGRPARPRRRARLPVPRGPQGTALLHQGVQARHHRCRWRRERADRGRVLAAHDRR